MPKVAPTTIYPGYEIKAAGSTVTADSIVIPRSAIPGLSDTEANATTGDGMEVLRQLVVQGYTIITGLPVGEKPTKMTFNKQPVRFLENGNISENFILATELAVNSVNASLASE